jgi:pimeloyl-ACP methyl ester carboxylesterase
MTEIVLLHGALGAAEQLAPLAERLSAAGRVHVVELEGHGSTPSPRGFAMAHFVENALAALDALGVGRATLFGYSMGGYVALLLAAAHPERAARVITLGTKFRWDPETAAREARRLDPAAVRAKGPRFADALETRHAGAGGWELVLSRTADLLRALGDAPPLTDETLGRVRCPVCVAVGDRDATVSVEETAGAYRALPDGALAVLPRTAHPIEGVDLDAVAALVR